MRIRVPRGRQTWYGVLAILLWSTSMAVMRSLSERVGALEAGASVCLVGGTLFVAGRVASRRSLREYLGAPLAYLLGCGSLFVAYMLAICLAVGLAGDRDRLLEVALINYLWPTLTIVFSLLFCNKRASLLLAPATLLALLGVFLVLTQHSGISWASARAHVAAGPWPYALAFAGAVAWGLYSALAGRWADPRKGGAAPLFLVASGLFLLAVRLAAGSAGPWTPRAVGEALFLGSATGLAYVLWDVSMRRGDVGFVASCSYLTPLLSTCVSIAYLGASAGSRLWWGCGLIIAGAVLSRVSIREREH